MAERPRSEEPAVAFREGPAGESTMRLTLDPQ